MNTTSPPTATLPRTALSIILETAAFYTADPSRRALFRGIKGATGILKDVEDPNYNSGSCEYLVKENGNMCAVGRCALDAAKLQEDFGGDDVFGISGKSAENENQGEYDENDETINHLDSLLKPEYRGHSLHFWSELQNFHDNSSYWNKEGLTERGRDRLIELLTHWG